MRCHRRDEPDDPTKGCPVYLYIRQGRIRSRLCVVTLQGDQAGLNFHL